MRLEDLTPTDQEVTSWVREGFRGYFYATVTNSATKGMIEAKVTDAMIAMTPRVARNITILLLQYMTYPLCEQAPDLPKLVDIAKKLEKEKISANSVHAYTLLCEIHSI